MYAMAYRGCRFSAVNILPWMREMSLCAKSRFVVKLRLASSRLLTKRRGTGPSRLLHSNISVVRGHSSRRHVATASLKQKICIIYFSNKSCTCIALLIVTPLLNWMSGNLYGYTLACECPCVFSNFDRYCLLVCNARVFSNSDGYCLFVFLHVCLVTSMVTAC